MKSHELPLGFISPTGEFIPSEAGEHGDTAEDILLSLGEDQHKINDPWFYTTEYLIYTYNYALIHMPEFGFNAVNLHYHILSSAQKQYIEKYQNENDNVYFIEKRVTKGDLHG